MTNPSEKLPIHVSHAMAAAGVKVLKESYPETVGGSADDYQIAATIYKKMRRRVNDMTARGAERHALECAATPPWTPSPGILYELTPGTDD